MAGGPPDPSSGRRVDSLGTLSYTRSRLSLGDSDEEVSFQLRVQSSYTFDADIQTVWDSMLSSEVLAGCIPGCDDIRPIGENSYEIDLTIRVAAVRGAYKGEVRLEEIENLTSYRMVVKGSGRGGSVQGTGHLRFSESGGKTVVDVTGDTQVTGVVARVGQRLLGGASRMMMNQFFDCLRSKIETS